MSALPSSPPRRPRIITQPRIKHNQPRLRKLHNSSTRLIHNRWIRIPLSRIPSLPYRNRSPQPKLPIPPHLILNPHITNRCRARVPMSEECLRQTQTISRLCRCFVFHELREAGFGFFVLGDRDAIDSVLGAENETGHEGCDVKVKRGETAAIET